MNEEAYVGIDAAPRLEPVVVLKEATKNPRALMTRHRPDTALVSADGCRR